MTRRIVLVVLSALFCSFLTSTARAATLPRPAARLLRAVNTARIAHGDRPLRLDWTLTAAARAHSSDMLANDYFAHGDFGGRMTAYHVRGLRMGENLAWGNGPYAQATAVVRVWLSSPEHRANLLDPRFARIGVGVARGSFQGAANAAVVTADFAG